ncbi:hypothetical protein C3E87_06970, partial [Tessaracoccus sp. ZS01]
VVWLTDPAHLMGDGGVLHRAVEHLTYSVVAVAMGACPGAAMAVPALSATVADRRPTPKARAQRAANGCDIQFSSW